MCAKKLLVSRGSVLLIFLFGVINGLRSQDVAKPKTEYMFQPQEKKRVLLARSPFFYEGHLDDNGAFVPDPKARPIECKVKQDDALAWIAELEKARAPIYNLNRGGLHVDPVYHYFSGGWLIVGQIAGEDFYPEIRKNNTIKVISLDDYLKKYDPERHARIYNLPGQIVKKGEGKKKDKEKKK
jgi:hypothetical protein